MTTTTRPPRPTSRPTGRPTSRPAARDSARSGHPTALADRRSSARPSTGSSVRADLGLLAPVHRLRVAVGTVDPAAAPRVEVRQPSGHRSRSFVILFAILGLLNAVGLTMILSASSVSSMAETDSPWSRFAKQAIWLVLGLVGMVVALRIDYHRWQRWARPFMIATGASLVLVLLVGKRFNGSKRWLGVGQATVQPSEMAKLAVLLFVADLLARRSHRIADTRLTLRPVLVVVVPVSALVLLQPNLSTAVIICAIAFVTLFVAGVPLRSLAVLGLVLALGAGVLAAAAPYRMQRLLSFSDPFADAYGKGYQSAQSQIALNNGEITGTGFGQGRGKYGYLPEADTDFIFSVVGEETGFLGACVVIGLFLALGAVAVKVAFRAPDPFGMLVATGVAAWIIIQAFVNIGVAVGILPNTGVPLPFLSAGGSSLIFTMTASGILLNIARHTP